MMYARQADLMVISMLTLEQAPRVSFYDRSRDGGWIHEEEDQESRQQCLNIFPPNCKSFHPPRTSRVPRTITNYCAADNIWLTISKQAGVEITAAMLTSGAGARWSGVFTEFPTLGTTLHTRQVWVQVSLKWGLQAAATIRTLLF